MGSKYHIGLCIANSCLSIHQCSCIVLSGILVCSCGVLIDPCGYFVYIDGWLAGHCSSLITTISSGSVVDTYCPFCMVSIVRDTTSGLADG